MSWLLPSVAIPIGTVRTIGEPPQRELLLARRQRWTLRKGAGYWRRRAKDPEKQAAANARSRKWYQSEKGKAYLERNRERRNEYYRLRMTPERRAYLAAKQREYRADPIKRETINRRKRESRARAKACAATSS